MIYLHTKLGSSEQQKWFEKLTMQARNTEDGFPMTTGLSLSLNFTKCMEYGDSVLKKTSEVQ